MMPMPNQSASIPNLLPSIANRSVTALRRRVSLSHTLLLLPQRARHTAGKLYCEMRHPPSILSIPARNVDLIKSKKPSVVVSSDSTLSKVDYPAISSRAIIRSPKMAQAKPPVFVSLGMFILDELRFPHLKTVSDVPGGSGFYATLGARLFKPYPQSLDVGCIILGGHDIPQSAVDLLESWRINLFLHRDPEQKCTRGLLQYEDDAFSRNTFDYVTPPLRPSPEHLVQSNLLHAQAFHFLNLPADLERNVTTLLRLRAEHGISTRPLIVWEPAPMGCTAAYLDATLKACAHVDIFSPNRSELRALLSGTQLSTSSTEKQGDANDNTNDEFSRSTIESQAAHFLTAGINPHKTGHAVIRAGEHGVLVQSLTHPPQWLPTYYTSTPSTPSTSTTDNENDKNDKNDKNKNKKKNKKVIDATGAGNAFLGAFAVSFHDARPGDVVEACLRGAVAASFALEQFGPPTLSYSALSSPSQSPSQSSSQSQLPSEEGEKEGVNELWNGENVMTRLNELKARISKT